MILYPIQIEIKDSITYGAKVIVPAGETVAVWRIPGQRSITVQAVPGAGATATVYATLEGDKATIEADDHTAPYLIAWPAGDVTSPTIDAFLANLGAVCCRSVGGETVLYVRG